VKRHRKSKAKMKLLHKYIEKGLGGSITLTPDDTEDMWHSYNLVSVGDSVRASTFRKVTTEGSTGSRQSTKIRLTLTITVEDIDFDTQACKLRVKGRNIEENEHVKLGAYHTIDIEPNRKFTLAKAEWDTVSLERIEMATDPSKSADVAAVVMQEGLANLVLISGSMTIVRAKIDVSVPRKRRAAVQQHEKALNRFFDAIVQAILRHVNFDVVKCLLVASPGFTKDQFFEYMINYANKAQDGKVLLDNKGKVILVHSSSGFKHSLKEVLQDPALQSRLADTKATEEVRCLESFYRVLTNEPLKAFYGEKHVLRAAEAQAIEVLLISDRLFRAADVVKRKRFVKLVDEVREYGGDVKIFSSMHVSGEQLEQLTGICAILRFPMQELEDSDSEGD
jgi:protein pelota